MRNMLNEVHSLSRKRIDYFNKQPLVASNVQSIPLAVKLPICTTYGERNGNQTQQSVSSIWSGKRYKRETNLKFSDGSAEVYESFRSKWNIHHRMLCWDDHRAGVELYISLEGKAALKIEEVLESADGTWDVTKMWDALDPAFLR